MKLETSTLLRKGRARTMLILGHVARGPAGKELRDCIRSSDKKIGKRKIRWIETISEMTGDRGIEKRMEFAEYRLELRRRIEHFDYSNNAIITPIKPSSNRISLKEKREE